jgi:hypothetical protein
LKKQVRCTVTAIEEFASSNCFFFGGTEVTEVTEVTDVTDVTDVTGLGNNQESEQDDLQSDSLSVIPLAVGVGVGGGVCLIAVIAAILVVNNKRKRPEEAMYVPILVFITSYPY